MSRGLAAGHREWGCPPGGGAGSCSGRPSGLPMFPAPALWCCWGWRWVRGGPCWARGSGCGPGCFPALARGVRLGVAPGRWGASTSGGWCWLPCVVSMAWSRGAGGGWWYGVGTVGGGGSGGGCCAGWGSGHPCGLCGSCVCAPCGPCGSWPVVVPRCGWKAAAWASGWGCGPYVMGGCWWMVLAGMGCAGGAAGGGGALLLGPGVAGVRARLPAGPWRCSVARMSWARVAGAAGGAGPRGGGVEAVLVVCGTPALVGVMVGAGSGEIRDGVVR